MNKTINILLAIQALWAICISGTASLRLIIWTTLFFALTMVAKYYQHNILIFFKDETR